MRACLVPQCSYPPHRPRHQRSLANCDWIPASCTSRKPSNPRRHPTCLASSQWSHSLKHAVPWSLDICSTQRSLVHRVQTHGVSNRDIHLYPPHNISSVHPTTYVRHSGRITNGMRGGRTAPQDSAFSSPTLAPTIPVWPSQEEPGSDSTASAPVSDVSTPACTNGVCPPLRPVSVAQKNKPSAMLSSNVQSVDLLMDCMAWRFWAMRQSNGCSTPAPRSSAAKQWIEELAQKKKNQLLSLHLIPLPPPTGCLGNDFFL